MAGHCGWLGIGGLILTVSIGTLLFTGVSLGITLSFHSEAGALVPLAAPFIYDMMGPVFWISGGITGLVGFILLVASGSGTRIALLNVWVALLILHALILLTYGIHTVLRIRDLYLIHNDIFKVISEGGLWLLDRFAQPTEKLKQKVSQGGVLFVLAEHTSAAGILKAAPYPFDFLFFLGLRPDICSVLYVVLPGTFAFFSIPAAMAVRNYFAENSPAVTKHRERYEDMPLSSFMCGGGQSYDEGKFDEEEDLASTFDGSSFDSDESESLLGSSSSETSR